MKADSDLRRDILYSLELQKGILLVEPALVYRDSYNGRDVIARNSRFTKEYTDERGYVPVEWWITSTTKADNQIYKKGEGLTNMKLASGESVLLRNASEIAEVELFGSYKNDWPLVKILDIGGKPVTPSFSEKAEVPPIPVHIHAGNIVEGRAMRPGKVEAYFFPPLDVPPYNTSVGRTITRIGLRQDVSKEEFKRRLTRFARDDSMYDLLRKYAIIPNSTWTIPERVIHAPGPWVTFEIQSPQDDWNLASWRMGVRSDEPEFYNDRVLRGLKDEDDYIDQLIDWDLCVDPDFENAYFREIQVLDEGGWGRRYRIFFHWFYGESWVVEVGKSVSFPAKEKPIGAIVWSGAGRINGMEISNPGAKEFFIVPGTSITLENASSSRLILYTVEPLADHNSTTKSP